MKTVLCYGDSNTWGYRPNDGSRYGHSERWTRRLQALLGSDVWVVEEGQNGRTTVHDDPVEGIKNGLAYLLPCLESHKPVDAVVLMLGTNDLKHRFGKSAGEIARSVRRLVRTVQTCEYGPAGGAPRVLLVAPPPVASLSAFAVVFEGAGEKSRELAAEYRLVAQECGCAFLDAGTVIRSSDGDGIHLDEDQLPLLAAAVRSAVVPLIA